MVLKLKKVREVQWYASDVLTRLNVNLRHELKLNLPWYSVNFVASSREGCGAIFSERRAILSLGACGAIHLPAEWDLGATLILLKSTRKQKLLYHTNLGWAKPYFLESWERSNTRAHWFVRRPFEGRRKGLVRIFVDKSVCMCVCEWKSVYIHTVGGFFHYFSSYI